MKHKLKSEFCEIGTRLSSPLSNVTDIIIMKTTAINNIIFCDLHLVIYSKWRWEGVIIKLSLSFSSNNTL
ncbi:hypothetical protein EB796_007598 [Bugula neritina]|uniref:Uncharacterized protein n=1 Tax=Bugula neritina TaxID=10212 RepID=A0A7J7K8Z8_BUGNE|nr:hypothetical protein EB796_007598 [Bugula neritina]